MSLSSEERVEPWELWHEAQVMVSAPFVIVKKAGREIRLGVRSAPARAYLVASRSLFIDSPPGTPLSLT